MDEEVIDTERPEAGTGADDAPVAPSKTALVQKLIDRIKGDRRHHAAAFKQMRDDMHLARLGRDKDKPKHMYTANIVGRHVKMKTAALYAKNPKAVARRRETLDFAVWDENPQSLQTAIGAISMLQQATSGGVDPVTGQAMASAIPPELDQALAMAQATIEDYQQGMQRRQEINKIGKTLEILFAHALREQKPVDFKTAMKQLVRRTCTTGVGYIKLGFQRETGPSPDTEAKLYDARTRLEHMKRLAHEVTEEEVAEDDPEIAELELSLASLANEPEILIREGLIIDYPVSTRVIPDRLCKKLVGFIGAGHVTIEHTYACERVEEIFGVDLKQSGYERYRKDDIAAEAGTVQMDEDESENKPAQGGDLVCVWEHYDKRSGLVYWLADGYKGFLREPAAPDVFVEDFWPLYALTFNDVESEESLFPPSDVALLRDMQEQYNDSRQGMREHRKAARPRFATGKGIFDKEDVGKLAGAQPFDVLELNLPANAKVEDILQRIPVPGVDPNLYETGQLFTDMQLVAGTQEAQLGATAGGTATESAIAANASASADGSSVDDLDGFLSTVARAVGQILLREMTPEYVMRVVGPGAVWPQMSLSDIVDEIFLEIEAGSSGKPNRAVELDNWQKMMPFLVQMPGIKPEFLARETLRRLDDRMDLTEAMAPDVPSIMAMNAKTQVGTGDPATDPNQQGQQGAANAPKDNGAQAGSQAAFGDNKGDPAVGSSLSV